MLQAVMEIQIPPTLLADFVPHLDQNLTLGDIEDEPLEHTTAVDAARCEDDHAAESALHFADQLLAALATMAIRSKRRQADLSAALCRAGLDRDPTRVTDALRHLEQTGCIEHLVPLYDGGVLMSVTSRGIEKLSAAPRWTMLDGAGVLR
jgi:hypothetical protein